MFQTCWKKIINFPDWSVFPLIIIILDQNWHSEKFIKPNCQCVCRKFMELGVWMICNLGSNNVRNH